jgi:hypothetical protein
MSKKRIKKAVIKKPNWVGNVDISKCEKGKVYNIYKCRKCVIEYSEDQLRQGRRRSLLLPGNKKKKIVSVCKCKKQSLLLIKYKKCTCNIEYWGFFLRANLTCKLCGAYSDIKKEKQIQWYRMNKFLKKTEEDLSDLNKWDCVYRDDCLNATKINGSNKRIACKNCSFYLKSEII